MRYCLGVDIGNSAVTAAVADDAGVETVRLGRQTPSLPAVVHVTPDGSILTGEEAVRAATLEPVRTARLLGRRLDDPAPLQLGELTCEITDLLGTLLWDVLDRVTTLRGGPPAHTVLTRPAALGARGRDRLAEAAARAGQPDATTTTATLACGTWFAGTGRRIGRFAVYDFGGAAVEAAVLRGDANGVEQFWPPGGVPHFGGTDLDELLRRHLDTRLGGALSRWDPHTREGARTRNAALAACAAAKEALSTQDVVEVTLPLPSGVRRCLLHRDELDALFRSPVGETVEALRRVLSAAGVRPGELDVLLLTGGSTRIPLVKAMLQQRLGPDVHIEQAADDAVAQGAARLARKRVPPPAGPARRPGPPPGPPRAVAAAARIPPPGPGAPRPQPPAPEAVTEFMRPGPPPVPPPTPPAPFPVAPQPATSPRGAPPFTPAPSTPGSGTPSGVGSRGTPSGVGPYGVPGEVGPRGAPGGAGAPFGAPTGNTADTAGNTADTAGNTADTAGNAAENTTDGSWRNPAIGRSLALALALLAVLVAIGAILFVVLHRINGAAAGLVAPQSLVEAWWTFLGPLS